MHSMDRLCRNLDDLRRIVKKLTSCGVVVKFHKEGLTFTGDDSPMSNLLLSMLGAVAEFERSISLNVSVKVSRLRRVKVSTGEVNRH